MSKRKIPTNGDVPAGWTVKTLGDLMTTEQLLRASLLLKQGRHVELRAYLEAPDLAHQLENKGVVPAYLYYWLVYNKTVVAKMDRTMV